MLTPGEIQKHASWFICLTCGSVHLEEHPKHCPCGCTVWNEMVTEDIFTIIAVRVHGPEVCSEVCGLWLPGEWRNSV
jgi:hypothetical protein